MKIIQWRKKLYSVSSCSIAVPVARKVNTQVGQWADEESVNNNASSDTTIWSITIPWLHIEKFDPEPSIFSFFGNDLGT